MAKTPDHMKGIDSLPKWDRANPTTYNYVWNDYDPADYAKFKEARLAAHPVSTDWRNPFGKEGTLAKSINKQLAGFEAYRQKQVNQAVADAAPKHARLIADGEDSTCLERLTWKDGIATATFFRGGQITYDYPMSRDQFVEWVSFGSLGRYGNENVFD